MSSTNKTTYYELSQFLAEDKPAWLQDYNGDMAKIDAGIHEAKNAADNAQTAADAAQSDATSALNGVSTLDTEVGTIETNVGTLTTSLNTVNSLIGNGTPTTSDQTIIGAINSIEASIAPAEDGDATTQAYQIGEQFMRGGTLYEALVAIASGTAFNTLTVGTDYTVSDTIAEQISEVSGTYQLVAVGQTISAAPDGVKTLEELMNEVAIDFNNLRESLSSDYYIQMERIRVPGYNLIPNAHFVNGGVTHGSTAGLHVAYASSAQKVYIGMGYAATTSGSSYYKRLVYDISAGTFSFEDRTSTVPTSDEVYIEYNLYKKI